MHKLNLVGEKLSYQNTNTLATNPGYFCYYQKFAKVTIKKKTLALALASKEEMHLFELIYD